MNTKTIEDIVNDVARHLYSEFCKKYGEIISYKISKRFLNQVDDIREVNEDYVLYLYEYTEYHNLMFC